MSATLAIAIALLLLVGNAFFVGAEFALISARRSKIELLAEEGSRRAAATLRAMEDVAPMMACAQLGITVCSLGLGAVGEPLAASILREPLRSLGVPHGWLHPIALILALSVVAVLHTVLGEMVPKNIAIAGPDRSALVLGPPLATIARLLGPVITALNAAALSLLRAMGVEPRSEVASSYTADEVAQLVDQSHEEGLLDEQEHELLTGVLAFEGRHVGSLLIPRERLVILPSDPSVEDIHDATTRTGFSRFPVEEAGAFVGYLHVKDLLVADAGEDLPPVRPLAHVEVGASLRTALETMQAQGAHMAEVLGGDGSSLGVIALEDVLEELVGEIQDAASAGRAGGQPV